MRTVLVALVWLALIGLSTPAGAAAEGWSMGNWFGAGSKDSPKKSSSNKTRWGGSKKKEDSGFFSLVRGDDAQKAERKKSYLGSQGTRSRNKEEEKPSFWKSLFGKEEPKQPQTVKEWMSQPRLDP